MGIFVLQTYLTLAICMETVREGLLHSVQCHVSEYRGNNAALRSTLIGGKQLVLEYEPCFQKLLEH